MNVDYLIAERIGILCENKKDVDKVLRIASKKKWHWRSGCSAMAFGLTGDISILFDRDDWTRQPVLFYEDAKKGKAYKSVKWFEKNFGVRHRA